MMPMPGECYHRKNSGNDSRMPKRQKLNVDWSERAIVDFENIEKYLLSSFTEKEVASYHALLKKFESAISVNPYLYKVISKKKRLHRAVLSKYLSAVYRIHKVRVEILAV